MKKFLFSLAVISLAVISCKKTETTPDGPASLDATMELTTELGSLVYAEPVTVSATVTSASTIDGFTFTAVKKSGDTYQTVGEDQDYAASSNEISGEFFCDSKEMTDIMVTVKAGNAENNYIDISDSDLSLEMTVVAAESNSPVCSHFSNNYVSIKNSTINLSAAVHAAHNVAGTAKDSVVSIDNSTITNENGSVYIYGAYVDNGEVSGNQVILNNTKFDFGDNKHAAFICAAMVEDGSAHDNSVSLIGNNEFDATGLSKVHFIGAKGSGIFSDNVLLLDRWKGQVSSVSNFEGIKFSNIAWESGATILKIQHQPYYDDFIEDLLIDSGETDISVTSFIVGNDSFIFTGGIDSHLGESMTLVNSVDKVKFNPVYDGKGQEVSFSSSLTLKSTNCTAFPNDSIDFFKP